MCEIDHPKLIALKKYIDRRYSIKCWPAPSNYPSFEQFYETYWAKKQRKAEKVAKRVKGWQLHEKTGGRICYYCRRPFNKNGLIETVDHVIPLCRGGVNDLWNKVACCKGCNNWKNNMLLNEWRQHLLNCINPVASSWNRRKYRLRPTFNREILRVMVENITNLMKEIKIYKNGKNIQNNNRG